MFRILKLFFSLSKHGCNSFKNTISAFFSTFKNSVFFGFIIIFSS